MKSTGQKFILLLLVSAFFPTLHSLAQGSFGDLDFESANIPAGTAAGPISTSALTSWSVSPYLTYDDGSVGGVLVSITDANSQYTPPPLDGKYSVILYAGPDGPAGASYISQTATVPANAQSIQMDVAYLGSGYPPGTLVVTLGGTQVTMGVLQTYGAYSVYGGNIPTMAGDLETLAITELPPAPPIVPPSAVEIDDIIFSNEVIPEPQTWTLLLCGAGALAAWRRKQTQ